MIQDTVAHRGPGRSSRSPRESADWFAYFSSRRDILKTVDWGLGRGLTDDEKLRITSSIREFQLGESSEGRNLNQFAKCYSEEEGDPLYYECTKFFIREEQRHAQVLGRFMEREGIAALKRCFVDSVFRHLRRYAGLEVSLTVLLMAEIISLAYYRALRASTGSGLLRTICEEILKDEKAHLAFHCQRLAWIRERHGWPLKAVLGVLQTVLFSGTCIAVWLNHRKVLAIRYPGSAFFRTAWRIYASAMDRIRRGGTVVKRSPDSSWEAQAGPA